MRTRSLRALLAILIAYTTYGATAAPVIIRTDLFTDVISANATFGVAAGNYLQLDSTASSPFLPSQMTAVAVNVLDPSISRSLNFYTGPIFAEKNFNRFLTNLSLTSAWNLHVSDPSGTTSGVIDAIAEPELLPLLLNLHVVQDGSTPLVAWDLPNLSGFDADRTRVRVTDAASGVQIFQSGALAVSATSFMIPGGVLSVGETYEFRVLLEDLEGASGLENRSNTFSGLVTLVPEPGILTLLGLAVAGMAAMRRRKKEPSH